MNTPSIRNVEEKLFSTKTSSEKMDEELRSTLPKIREERLRKLHQNQNTESVPEISEEEMQKISELADFISEYVREVGKEQAVLDFQVGLNLLNNYKKESIVEEKIQLKEDADFGEKTFASLLNILSVYPVDIVKWFVKLGAINNQIWSTKNVTKVNTDKNVEQVEFARYRAEKVKKELSNLHSQAVVLEGGVEKVRILVPLFEKILKEALEILGGIIGKIENYIEVMKKIIYVTWEQFKKDNYKLIRIVLNTGINIVGLGPLNDARQLWNYASFDGAQNYIKQNGKIISQVSDLNNNKLETIVKTKLNSQFKIKEAIGIEFKSDSAIAKSIYKSNALRNFVRENKTKLDTKKRLQDNYLIFKPNDLNLHMALKRVDIVDIELDVDKNLLAKIIDTYDFNSKEGHILVQLGNAVQEGNMLKPYYEIILLKIPYEEWIKF